MRRLLPRLLLLLFLCPALNAFCQEKENQNPVLFADVSMGHSWGGAGGFTGGASLHLQTGRHFWTGRFSGTTRVDAKFLSILVPVPFFEEKSSLEEYSVLYGRRWVEGGRAFSFSAGVSHSRLRQQLKASLPPTQKMTTAVGLPFAASVKWFKARKERFRIYGIFPVGQPTGFGGSFGFTFVGNLSRYSYAGIVASMGLGYHKQYR